MTIPNRNFNYPTAIKFGAGRVKELADLCKANGIKRPLFVTDPGLAASPMVADILADLKAAGLPVQLFSDVRPNPVEANIIAGVKAYKMGMHDGVIAFGGGSGLDIGKMIALMHGQSISVFDLEDIGDWWTRADASRISPIIAVPTTAGTGSEVGRAGVVTHPDTHEKKVIFHPAIMPKVALLDPELTVGLPAKLTAATGFDALAHCIEAYSAPFYHPLSKGIALEGMLLIKDNLATAVKKPKDLDARGNMLMASTMGATAFQRGLGAVHALSHPIGGLYDAHHGLLNGIVLPYVLVANRKKIEKDFARAAAYLEIKGGFDGFLKWVLALRKDLGIPHTLADIGIDTKRLGEVAAMAIKDPSAGGNPIQFTEKQYKALAKKCVEGEL
ncbi:iron-containing alcohol dehydrogenase [Aestuariivirga litoralis]|uniref:iron-containing alcohol dehydrogenase n=1 Tax=Aestuariivirga litoralis TaxID=2650924 RepID=UPI0018C6C773|nr:iron-containing alcohol dehydrogenase [Aestuariivirga litoralis]MBG1233562.1 iron-containing alcohol dehydrogenase [Aestuariivirga litoralis]